MIRAPSRTCAAAVLLITLASLASTTTALAEVKHGEEPFWHFAVRMSDENGVLIIFPADWKWMPSGITDFPPEDFILERASTADFTDAEDISQPYSPAGLAWAAMDVAWEGPRPWYRVRLKHQGKIIATSDPQKPLDNYGNTFVTRDPPVEGVTCGDLAVAGCPDLQSAIAAAAPGSTIYAVPGIYFGPGNTNLTFGGKAVTLESTNGQYMTLINGTDPDTGVKSRIFSFTNGEGRDTVIKGFSMTGGEADLGGCMYIKGATPTIRESNFVACNATVGIATGGGVAIMGSPAPGPLFDNVSFIFNFAGIEGAGMYVGGSGYAEVENSFFEWGILPTATGRGGAIAVVKGNVTVRNTTMRNGIVGFGGGAVFVESGGAVLDQVTVFNNSAGNFGGGINAFASHVTITRSNITSNRASITGGGAIFISATLDTHDSIYNDNVVRQAGGGIEVAGGAARLTRCQVNDNIAFFGGGLHVSTQKDLTTVRTELIVVDSEVKNNAVTDRGGGLLLTSYDTASFTNVTFTNNTAAKTGGGGYCEAETPATFSNVTFNGNSARMGGGFFGLGPCSASMDLAVFKRNVAVEAGGGVALADGVTLNITRSVFEANGVSNCDTTKPPAAGGAIMIGQEGYQANQQCGATDESIPTNVTITDTSFVGNVATLEGGGIHLEAGSLVMEGVELEGNSAVGSIDTADDGLGGGISIIERCLENDVSCSVAKATITRSQIRGNTARSAGGGLYFAGGSRAGRLTLSQSLIDGNTAEYTTSTTRLSDGVGGGIFLGRTNFTLSDLTLRSNGAYYGGALFIAADLAAGARLQRLKLTSNKAVVGAAAFWLRSASPAAALDASSMSVTPEEAGAISTEVLHTAYQQAPPKVIQSAEDVESFSVTLMDYYKRVSVSEQGTCSVVSAATQPQQPDNSSSVVTIRPLGSKEDVRRGEATFSQLQVSGLIGEAYSLQLSCVPNAAGRSRFLGLRGEPLPALPLPVRISQCKPGSEPTVTSDGAICVKCPYNSFNLDGQQCRDCPRGGLCIGGDQLAAKADFWRSSNSSTTFYACHSLDVCEEGVASGDAACKEGTDGPLCAVCAHGWFSFGGKCQSCNTNGLSKTMLAISVILIVTVVVLLFARSWEFGNPGQPGMLVKLKLCITHFQILALFRDYDVLWPDATAQGFSFFDTFNVGVSMMAPSCTLGRTYNFWWKWVFQMLLPVGAVSLSVAMYVLADYLLRRQQARVVPEGEDSTPISSAVGESATQIWLQGLKTRCWKNAFWLLTLLYPRSSMTALQMFALQKLDTGTYLTADFSIRVRNPGGKLAPIYLRYMIPGAIMLFMFAIVVPAFFFVVIWRNRHRLDERATAERYGFLYGAYKRRFAYWETFESLRKLSYAMVPVFVKPNAVGSIQGTVGQVPAFTTLIATVWLQPYAVAEDNYVAIASMGVLWLLLLSGCTAKWADPSPAGLRVLAAFQLLLSSGIAFACFTLLGISIARKLKNRQVERLKSSATEDGDAAGRQQSKGGIASKLSIKVNAWSGSRQGASRASAASDLGCGTSRDSGCGGEDTPSLRRPFLAGVMSRFSRTSSGQVPVSPGDVVEGGEAQGSPAQGAGGDGDQAA